MALNLIKLCVGCESIDDLAQWQAARLADYRRRGEPAELKHTTRMMPRRRDELLGGGSLYWVIKGFVQARQRLVDIRPFTDADGIRRCHLVLDSDLVAVAPRPFRAFQGWRYYPAKDAPLDLRMAAKGADEMPAELRRQLAALGLL
ncbi:MAG: DUF1489 domain-containing protein [Hyphomicrobiales bacterium]|nr:DUF1489 domain-containing protein [Hyphomicrobiales bacterium]